MKNHTGTLFAGTVLAVTDIDEILCMRLKGSQGRYPIVTYEETVYTQRTNAM